ncbi:hypothetical protein AMS68_002427 [Peltaster fructicola]|uniref:Uncharacterized protein n=1 Tax=Peltaster fructicola TaxID=286661 RepID=A0A6H0XR17_9PEZI|nr:hypothetical protein AMS68_002427 [Peltaster fructicola]
MEDKSSQAEPIAIIGTSCRLAGYATSPSKLWQMLLDSPELSKNAPKARYNAQSFFHPDGEHHGTTNATMGYWLEEDHRVFDAAFFNIAPKEAEAIDPQQKQLLEVVFEGMESAGLTIQGCYGTKTAVYVGTMTADFSKLCFEDKQTVSQYTATGCSNAIISNRISYFYNWHGPSMTIDTACSSSLVAMHQAVLGLRSGEASLACVAGANIMLTPENFILESSLHMLSPTGTSKMWDAGADGYARGEGVACVFLKTLSQALKDGDHIEAIIRQTGVNSDGRSKGITMPSPEAQALLIRDTYERSGLDCRNPEHRCQYFECHGTGTQAGDPREAEAVRTAFFDDAHPTDSGKLLVGSIKTVLGHTEGAAGLAGVLKVALAMKNGVIPVNKHLRTLNPSVLPFTDRLEVVTTKGTVWPEPAPGQPRRASVNSFGFGGTNAHAIIEQYEPVIHGSSASRKEHLSETPGIIPLFFSANSPTALHSTVKEHLQYIIGGDGVEMNRLVATLACRRSDLPYKTFFAHTARQTLADEMIEWLDKPTQEAGVRSKTGEAPISILGVFTGQGAQWPAMGAKLIDFCPSFARSLQKMDDVLKSCADPPSWTIMEALTAQGKASRISEAAISQPLCTALQVALVDLLSSCGIVFKAVVGHSSGEIGAAYAAGVLSARDAILIAYLRGQNARFAAGPTGAKGAMLAVGLTVTEALEICEGQEHSGNVYVAAINAPTSITLSGDEEAIHQIKVKLDDEKKFCRALRVDTAYHSHHMDSCAEPYLQAMQHAQIEVQNASDACIWISSVFGPVGTPSSKDLAGPCWRDNMVQPVLFTEALTRALQESGPFDAVLEVGPHPALKGPTSEALMASASKNAPYIGVLSRSQDDLLTFTHAVGQLWTHLGPSRINVPGLLASIQGLPTGSLPPLQGLPTYPWDHSKPTYRESRMASQYLHRDMRPHELLGMRQSDDFDGELRWRNILKPDTLPWLKHHRFQGQIIVPAAAYCIMALDSSRHLLPVDQDQGIIELQNVQIHNAITMSDNTQGVEIISTLTIHPTGQDGIISASMNANSASVDGDRRMRPAFSAKVLIRTDKPRLPQRSLEQYGMYKVDVDEFYTAVHDTGLKYTGPFRAVTTMKRRLGHCTATLQNPHIEDECTLKVRPAFMDVAFQTAFASFSPPGDGALWTSFLPQSFERIIFNLGACTADNVKPHQAFVDTYLTGFKPTSASTQASFSADVAVWNAADELEIQIEGFVVQSFASMTEADDRELFLETVWKPDAGLVQLDDTYNDEEHHATIDELCREINGLYTGSCGGPSREQLETVLAKVPYRSSLALLQSFQQEQFAFMIPGLMEELRKECYELAALVTQFVQVIEPIHHRYPVAKVLELDYLGTGLVTTALLRLLGTSRASHTYAHVGKTGCPSDVRPLASENVELADLTSSPLNIEAFKDRQFDIVVISKPEDLPISKGAPRMLVKPGGYLLVVQQSAETLLKERLLRCLVPGHEVKVLPAPAALSNELLDWNGFSEVFCKSKTSYCGASMMLLQAVDPIVTVLQQPLLHSSLAGVDTSGSIVIIGGTTVEVQSIATSLRKALRNWSGSVILYKSFEDASAAQLRSSYAIALLSDLDTPFLASPSAMSLEKLKACMAAGRPMMWVTSGARADNPYHRASMGMGRTLKHEVPTFRLQFVDVCPGANAANVISEAFLRLILGYAVDTSQCLWVNEHEIEYDAEGRLHIPRTYPLAAMNDRLNSVRRVIRKDRGAASTPIELVSGDSGYELMFTRGGNSKDLLSVKYSTARALPVGDSHLFLSIATDRSDQAYLVASESTASQIDTARSTILPIETQPEKYATYLAAVAAQVCAHWILEHAQLGPIVVHEASKAWKAALELSIAQRKIPPGQVYFSTTKSEKASSDPTYRLLQPLATARMNKLVVPTHVKMIINLATDDRSSTIPSTMLGPSAHIPFHTDLLLHQSSVRDKAWQSRAGSALGKACHTQSTSTSEEPLFLQQSMSTMLAGRADLSPFTIVDWSTASLTTTIIRQQPSSDLFSSEKSYLLVGLTGDLGQSLCRLMVTCGARHLILTSRNPDASPPWKAELEHAGVEVTIARADVASSKDMIALKQKIEQSGRLLGGIVQGAMVLRDGMFLEMSHEDYIAVLNPKVEGTRILHEVFSNIDLDFFVMMSSLTACLGSRGQSNYTAANMYMGGLAAYRRKRGLAACSIDIGLLYGVGYVNRTEGTAIYANLRKQGFRPISETDIHAMFIEAVVSGRSSEYPPELMTGLNRFDPMDKMSSPWVYDPRFGHLAIKAGSLLTKAAASNTASVKEQVINCSTEEEIVEVVKAGLTSYLGALLQIQPGDIKPDLPIIDLGVDSLAAVNIRTWFLRDIEKDMPVLKVLSGASITDLATEVAVTLFADKSTAQQTTASSGDSSNSYAEFCFQKIGPMTLGQIRIWLPWLLLEDKTVYNCTTSYRFIGALDRHRLEQALSLVIRRHEPFRTVYFTDAATGEAMQAVSSASRFRLEVIEEANKTSDVEAAQQRIGTYPYDLEKGDVFVATLLVHSPQLSSIVFGYHHVMIDAVSWQMFLQEMERYYTGTGSSAPVQNQFIDFASKQQSTLRQKPSQEKRAYWKSQFKDLPPTMPLLRFAKVAARQSLSRYDVQEGFIELNQDLVARIKLKATQQKCTTFHFYLATLQVLLHRALNVDDMCIGITDANRTDPDFVGTLGFFLDSLPLRFKLSTNESFQVRLDNTRDTVYDALSNSGIPLDTILQDVAAETDPTHPPLFQALVNYRLGALGHQSLGDVALEYLAYEDARHPFDFILSIDEGEGRAGLSLSMQKFLYDATGADTFLSTYNNLLEQFSGDTELQLGQCNLHDPAAIEQALQLGYGGAAAADYAPTLSTQFSKIVKRYPHELAIAHGTRQLTYQQMDDLVNLVAS